MAEQRTKRSAAVLEAAIRHVGYEVDHLVEAFHLLAEGGIPPGPLRNAVLESWIVHVRNLIDFAYHEHPREDDIAAADFFDEPSAWSTTRPSKTEAVAKAATWANKLSAHLTYSRLELKDQDGGQWPFVDVTNDLVEVLQRFIEALAGGGRVRWPGDPAALESDDEEREPPPDFLFGLQELELSLPAPDELLADARRLFAAEVLRPPQTAEQLLDLELGRRPRVALAYLNLSAAVEKPETQVFQQPGGVGLVRLANAGWAHAELAHWVRLASAEVASATVSDSRIDLGEDHLLELETRLRYEAAGCVTRDPYPLNGAENGPLAEFVIDVAGRTVHVECKNVRQVVNDHERLEIANARAMAEHVAHHVASRCPIGAIIRFESAAPATLPPPGVLLPALEALIAYANQKGREVHVAEDGRDSPLAREDEWGRLTLTPTMFMVVPDQEARAAVWSENGIHPFDGFVVAREVAPGGAKTHPNEVPLPRETVVAIGPVPSLRFDQLLKRQFEKAAHKARNSAEPLIVHLRLNVPEFQADLLRPSYFDGAILRRDAPIRVALTRILGKLPQLSPQILACEVSSLVSTGRQLGEGRVLMLSHLLLNPANESAQDIITDLSCRGVFVHRCS